MPVGERVGAPKFLRDKILARRSTGNATGETLTPFDVISTYSNFYEFGMEKAEPAENAGSLCMGSWSVRIEGGCAKPGNDMQEDILKPHTLEDRICHFRCVVAWPWLGLSLADPIRRFESTSKAKYIEFTTLKDPRKCRASIMAAFCPMLRACAWMRPCIRWR